MSELEAEVQRLWSKHEQGANETLNLWALGGHGGAHESCHRTALGQQVLVERGLCNHSSTDEGLGTEMSSDRVTANAVNTHYSLALVQSGKPMKRQQNPLIRPRTIEQCPSNILRRKTLK